MAHLTGYERGWSGRALPSHGSGHRFEPYIAHHDLIMFFVRFVVVFSRTITRIMCAFETKGAAVAKEIDIDLLRLLLSYDPVTGHFLWQPRPRDMFVRQNEFDNWNKYKAGTTAFYKPNRRGYVNGHILGQCYRAHRIAWAMTYGQWPSRQIDHINGDRSDNRIQNLRDVAHQTNGQNQKKPVTNTSGVCGVCWHRGARKWQARIRVNDRHIYLGVFDSMEEAVRVRKIAEREYGFHPNHGRAA